MKQIRAEKSMIAAIALTMAGILLSTPFYEIKIPLQTGSFYTLFQEGIKGNILKFLLPAAAVFSTGGLFLREYESGFIKFSLSRIGRMSYIREKVFHTCIGGAITIFISGTFLFISYFLFLFPMELKGRVESEQILTSLFMLVRLSLTAGILSGLSGIFGALFLNYYMSYGLPFICYYMMIILKERYLPEFYSLYPPEWIRLEQNWGKENAGIWYFLILAQMLIMLTYALILQYRLKEIN